MSSGAVQHRCPACRLNVEPVRSGDYQVSPCCDELVERVYLCRECAVRECHTGTDECLSCICDSVIADPRELEMCTQALRAEIAVMLAERLRPFLRTKQAA